MPKGRIVSFVLLGVLRGFGIVAGSYFGLRHYAPDVAARYIIRLSGASEHQPSVLTLDQMLTDAEGLRAAVQEVLSSSQSRAILRDLLESQSQEDLAVLFRTAMQSPEFQKALQEALGVFLDSPEGKALVRRVAGQILGD